MNEEVRRIKREVELMRLKSEHRKRQAEIQMQLIQAATTIFVQQINAPLYAFMAELKMKTKP